MTYYVSDDLLQSAVYTHPDLPLVYMNNPKAACSSIKASLWSYYDKMHQKESLVVDRSIHIKTGIPFIEKILDASAETKKAIIKKPIFSVVRNPFSRIAASYIHKLLGGDPYILSWFCERFFLKPETINRDSLPFEEFLKVIGFDDPLLLNVHFRRQSINILYPFVSYDFIGHLEDMGAVAEYLSAYNVLLESANISSSPDQEHKNKLVSLYNPKTIDLVTRLYSEDFENFGYSPKGGIFSGASSFVLHKDEGFRSFVMNGVRTQCSLRPEYVFFQSFINETDRDAKLQLIREASHDHKNRGILRHVIGFLLTINECGLAEEIRKHLYFCNTGHLEFLSDRKIIAQERLVKIAL